MTQIIYWFIRPVRLSLHVVGIGVTLHPIDHRDSLPAVGLFFSREEFDDLIFRQYPILEYHFHSSFLDSVFHLMAGHVGAVLAFVMVIVSNDVSLLYQYLAELMI